MKKVLGFLLFLLLNAVPAFGEAISPEVLQTLALPSSHFSVDRIYNGLDGGTVAVRLIHKETCAPLTVIQKEIVPQFFITVDTPPHDDRGLPHSLEHLLAGKGTKGRFWTLMRQMRLSRTVAATAEDYTFYGFDSPIGISSFYEQLHALLDALIRPDFTDEEAVHEFFHFSAEKNPSTGLFSLIEKGTVYSEEQNQYGYFDYYRALFGINLGSTHPWRFNAGGDPKAMRDVTPAMIREFHRSHYILGPATHLYLGLSKKLPFTQVLNRVNEELVSFSNRPMDKDSSPSSCTNPRDAAINRYPLHLEKNPVIRFFPFPAKNASQPANLKMAWKPVKTESLEDIYFLRFFMQVLGEDTESPLYRNLIIANQRKIESGATDVDAGVDGYHDASLPIPVVALGGIPGNRISEDLAKKIRSVILDTIRHIDELSDSSPELKALQTKALALIKYQKRNERIGWATSPKMGSQSFLSWKHVFDNLDMKPGETIGLSSEPILNHLEEVLRKDGNPWKRIIEKFHLRDEPHVAGSIPSPELLDQYEKDRVNRIEAETEKIQAKYHTSATPQGVQDALSQQWRDDQGYSTRMTEIAHRVPGLTFTHHPPLSPDPDTQYLRGKMSGKNGNPFHVSLFDETPFHEFRVRFDFKSVPKDLYPYLTFLPMLIDQVGLREGDQVTPSSQLDSQMENDNASERTWLDVLRKHEVYAWVGEITGATPDDLHNSLKYLDRIFKFPDFDVRNLPRIREILSQRISQDESFTTEGAIQGASESIRAQKDGLYLASRSFFTVSNWRERFWWRIHEPLSEEQFTLLNTTTQTFLNPDKPLILKTDWEKRIQALADAGIVGELKKHLLRNLKRLPSGSTQQGIQRLVRDVLVDLKISPAHTLQNLTRLKNLLLNRSTAEIEVETTPKGWEVIQPWIREYLSTLPDLGRSKELNRAADTASLHPIEDTIQKRDPSYQPHGYPYYFGLVNEDGNSGSAFVVSDGVSVKEPARALEYLTQKVFSGPGPQTFYMKTWETGLAYSNGIYNSASLGSLQYYADRSTDLGALMNLVRTQAKTASTLDPKFITDYVLANSFGADRLVADPPERASALANDFRMGETPERWKRFSKALLNAAFKPDFARHLITSAESAITPVLLNNEERAKKKSLHSIFLYSGPESQLRTLDAQIPTGEKLERIWPSDYWLSWDD